MKLKQLTALLIIFSFASVSTKASEHYWRRSAISFCAGIAGGGVASVVYSYLKNSFALNSAAAGSGIISGLAAVTVEVLLNNKPNYATGALGVFIACKAAKKCGLITRSRLD